LERVTRIELALSAWEVVRLSPYSRELLAFEGF